MRIVFKAFEDEIKDFKKNDRSKKKSEALSFPLTKKKVEDALSIVELKTGDIRIEKVNSNWHEAYIEPMACATSGALAPSQAGCRTSF